MRCMFAFERINLIYLLFQVSVKNWGGRINNYRNPRVVRAFSYSGFNRSSEMDCSAPFNEPWKANSFTLDQSSKFPSTDVMNSVASAESSEMGSTTNLLNNSSLTSLVSFNN